MPAKYLVYTVANYSKLQVPLLILMLESLYKNTQYGEFDIMIVSNKGFIKTIKNNIFMKNMKNMNVLCIEYKRQYALKDERYMRFNVFEDIPHIASRYEKALYIEADCIVEKDIVTHLFEKLTPVPGILYPTPDGNFDAHDGYFTGLQDYTEEDKRSLREKRILPFSTGVMMFKPCGVMFAEFSKMKKSGSLVKKQHFYEQAIANKYFNTSDKTDTTFLKDVVMSRNIKTNLEGECTLVNTWFDVRTVINHFCGIGYYEEKRIRMERFMSMIDHRP